VDVLFCDLSFRIFNFDPTFAPPGTLPGLKNFIMAGQWVSPGGGLPSGLMSGRTAFPLPVIDE
jgi:phytoene dehydrogenase-like protein